MVEVDHTAPAEQQEVRLPRQQLRRPLELAGQPRGALTRTVYFHAPAFADDLADVVQEEARRFSVAGQFQHSGCPLGRRGQPPQKGPGLIRRHGLDDIVQGVQREGVHGKLPAGREKGQGQVRPERPQPPNSSADTLAANSIPLMFFFCPLMRARKKASC